jgi:TonB family protein
MVPPEEIDPNAPTTLPADFGEWDSGDSSATQPAAATAPEIVPPASGATKPSAKSATARVAVLPAAGRAPSAPPRPPAPAYAEVEPVRQAPQPQRAKPAESRPQAESAGAEKKTGAGKFVAIGVLVLLLGGGSLAYMKMRPKTVPANQPVPAQTAISNTTAATPSVPANGTTQTTANTPANSTQTAENPQQDQAIGAQRAAAMSQQLNAPSRISKDLGMLKGESAPPSVDLSAAGGESLGGGSPFAASSGPKVKVAAQGKVNISSGVAVGLLIQRTNPVYPPIARTARVSGTVVIQATISKSGATSNLRAVSGPVMLRQAALDAVKAWRYRPYMLDGQPVEVDTTVNVVFALPQ